MAHLRFPACSISNRCTRPLAKARCRRQAQQLAPSRNLQACRTSAPTARCGRSTGASLGATFAQLGPTWAIWGKVFDVLPVLTTHIGQTWPSLAAGARKLLHKCCGDLSASASLWRSCTPPLTSKMQIGSQQPRLPGGERYVVGKHTEVGVNEQPGTCASIRTRHWDLERVAKTARSGSAPTSTWPVMPTRGCRAAELGCRRTASQPLVCGGQLWPRSNTYWPNLAMLAKLGQLLAQHWAKAVGPTFGRIRQPALGNDAKVLPGVVLEHFSNVFFLFFFRRPVWRRVIGRALFEHFFEMLAARAMGACCSAFLCIFRGPTSRGLACSPARSLEAYHISLELNPTSVARPPRGGTTGQVDVDPDPGRAVLAAPPESQRRVRALVCKCRAARFTPTSARGFRHSLWQSARRPGSDQRCNRCAGVCHRSDPAPLACRAHTAHVSPTHLALGCDLFCT